MSETKLKPCPCCQEPEQLEVVKIDFKNDWRDLIKCRHCRTQAMRKYWNQRAPVNVDQTEVDALKARVAELGNRLSEVLNLYFEHDGNVGWPMDDCALLNRKPAASLLLHDADVIDRLYDKYDEDNCNDYDWCVKDFLINQAEELRKQANEAKS